MRSISDSLAAMVAHIHAAEKLITHGDASTFPLLRPVRLQMASLATGCFIACQHAIDQPGEVNEDLYMVRDEWKQLAGRMRTITAVYQSPEHPDWSDYTVQARLLIAELLRHIAVTRQLIAEADHTNTHRVIVQ